VSRPIAAAVAIAVLAIATGAWWLRRDDESASGAQPPQQVAGTPAPASPSSAPASSASAPAAAEESRWDPELIKRVEHKYRFLIGELRLTPAQLTELRELLFQQQQLRDMLGPANDPDLKQTPAERARLERALADIDARIRALIDPAQFARYENLRESDVEQRHLDEYRGGVAAMAPLSPQQERLILEARLRHKKRFEASLRDFGLDQPSLSAEERLYAHRNVAQTLNEYRDDFLAEVRPSLTEDQYFLLSNYETTEFARELERLQIMINGK
jgi:hypothetical protein